MTAETAFYDKTVLDDGMTVISERIGTVRSVALGIWVAVGSRDEDADEAGMSHFLEHMMFKGTPTRSAEEISQTFERLGAELNAFTGKEYTCYYSRMLDQHLPKAFEVLGDMVCNSSMEEKATRSEREVVLEEISRYEDTPDDRVHDLFAQTLWPTHPLGRPVLGRKETVGAFEPSFAHSFRSKHYRTGDVVIAAAGDVDHAALTALAREFLSLPESPRHERPEAVSVAEPRLEVLTKDTEQAHICYGVHALDARDPERFALSFMDAVLGGGMASRLFQSIREKNGLAYAVYSYHTLYGDTGTLICYAGTRPDNAEQVTRLMQAEIQGIVQNGITAEELDRVRESMKGQLVLGLESTRNRMTRLGKAEVTRTELLSIDELVQRVEAVTLEEVHSLAQRLFSQPPAMAVIGPFSVESMSTLLS